MHAGSAAAQVTPERTRVALDATSEIDEVRPRLGDLSREVAIVVGARVHALAANDVEAAPARPPSRNCATRPSPLDALVVDEEHPPRAELPSPSGRPPMPARRPPGRRARSCARRTGSTCRARPCPRPGSELRQPDSGRRGADLDEARLVGDRDRDGGSTGVELADVGDRARVLRRLAGVVGDPARISSPAGATSPAVASSREAKLILNSPALPPASFSASFSALMMLCACCPCGPWSGRLE